MLCPSWRWGPAWHRWGTSRPQHRVRMWCFAWMELREGSTGQAWWREVWGQGIAGRGPQALGPILPIAPEPALPSIPRLLPNQHHSRLDISAHLRTPFHPHPSQFHRASPSSKHLCSCPSPALSSLQHDISSIPSSANPRPNLRPMTATPQSESSTLSQTWILLPSLPHPGADLSPTHPEPQGQQVVCCGQGQKGHQMAFLCLRV